MQHLPGLRHFKTPERVWTIRDDIDLSDCQRILETPDHFLQDKTKQVRNDDLITMSFLAGQSGRYVLRRLNYGRFRHALRDFFRPSRARRAFVRGLMLEKAGLRTPRALAVSETRRLRWPSKAYLLIDEVENALSGYHYFLQKRSLPRSFITQTGDLVGKMHAAGFSHRDLKAANILLDEELQPWLIDLDGVRFCRRMPTSRAVADLAVLARDFKNDPKLLRWYGGRFLKRYCRARKMEREFRPLAREIMAAMDRR